MATPSITLYSIGGRSQTFRQSIPQVKDNLVVFLRDAELPTRLRKPRAVPGVPQTVHFKMPEGSRETFPMDEKMQRFFMGMNPTMKPVAMSGVCDAFFVIGGKFYQGAWNVFTGEGTKGVYAKYPGYLGFGGGTGRIVGEQGIYYMIEAVKPRDLPALETMCDYTNYEVGKLLKIPLTAVNGSKTNRFPHNEGRDVFSVLFSDTGYLLIEKERCRKVSVPEYPYQ